MGTRHGTRVPRIVQRLKRRLNLELLEWAYNAQRIEAVGRPVVFQIELTNHCPMTCAMCPRTDQMRRPLGFMRHDLFERLVDEAAATTGDVFLHHFGDSLVHPSLGAFIAYAGSKGIRTYLSANPNLLTDARIRALVDNGLHELVLSLDGVTSATAVAVRGPAAAKVERAEERIRRLVAYKHSVGAREPHLILQFVRQRQNEHEASAWLRKWSTAEGLARAKVKRFVAWDGSSRTIRDLRIEAEPAEDGLVCEKPWTSLTVLWDGRVVPCCFDFDGKAVLGDLRTQSLKEVWESEALRALRRSHRTRDLAQVELCRACKDKEGYAVGKWYYPFNRLLTRRRPLAEEWAG